MFLEASNNIILQNNVVPLDSLVFGNPEKMVNQILRGIQSMLDNGAGQRNHASSGSRSSSSGGSQCNDGNVKEPIDYRPKFYF